MTTDVTIELPSRPIAVDKFIVFTNISKCCPVVWANLRKSPVGLIHTACVHVCLLKCENYLLARCVNIMENRSPMSNVLTS